MKFFAKLMYKILGWKLKGSIPTDIKKCVMVAAPHTSNWDFFYGVIAFYIMGIKIKTPIKKELFFFPLGIILNALGGIQVDRAKAGKLVDNIVDLFKKYDELVIFITPEGTRSYAERWKTGFWHIAKNANVPIILGYIDYSKKTAGVGPVFVPTGNVDKDIEEVKNFYRNITAKYPDQGVK